MSDDLTTTAQEPAAEPAEASSVPVELTPSQADSQDFRANLDAEIDALWAQAEGKAPSPDPETPAQRETRTRNERGQFTSASSVQATADAAPGPAPTTETAEPVAEAAPPADQATLEQQAYEKAKADFERQQDAERAARERIEAEQRFDQEVGAYAGHAADRAALQEALEAANLGDYRALEALDVVLPNGKKVSEVRPDGAKGLTQEEAQNLAIAWRNADRYGDALAGRKIQQLIGYWDQQTQTALADPDVDAAAVRAYRTPGEQIKAAIDTTRANVEKRLTTAHQAELAARDKTIAEQAERINSLVNERGNLTSQRQAASAATPDRPGAPGNLRRDLPTPEELSDMSVDEAFKSGTIDRLFQSIPGGTRRRAG
jgi:hypothetical protein